MAQHTVRPSARGLLARLSLAAALFTIASTANALPGDPLGSEVTVNAPGDANRQYPAAASNARGETVIVWLVDLSVHQHVHAEIHGVRLAADGSVIGAEFRIAALTPLTAGYGDDRLFRNQPAVAMADDGSFVVSWTDSAQPGAVLAQRFTADGHAMEPPITVALGSGDILAATVAMNSRGDFIVGWSQYPRALLLERGSFRARLYTRAGKVSREFIVDPNLAVGIPAVYCCGITTLGSRPYGGSLGLGLADDGSFVTAWSSLVDGGALAYVNVFARRYNARGQAGATLPVAGLIGGPSRDLSVAITRDGARHAIAFRMSNKDYPSGATFVRSYVGDRADGPAQPVCSDDCTGYYAQDDRPALAMAADGSFVVGYTAGTTDDDTPPAVAVRRYASGGGAVGGERFVSLTGHSPSVALDDAGTLTVAWEQVTSAPGHVPVETEIHARRYAGP